MNLSSFELNKCFDKNSFNIVLFSFFSHLIKSYMNPGGYIIADNTLWYGHVLEDDPQDPQTKGIMEFNDIVAADESVEKIILPIRDGLTLIKIKK